MEKRAVIQEGLTPPNQVRPTDSPKTLTKALKADSVAFSELESHLTKTLSDVVSERMLNAEAK